MRNSRSSNAFGSLPANASTAATRPDSGKISEVRIQLIQDPGKDPGEVNAIGRQVSGEVEFRRTGHPAILAAGKDGFEQGRKLALPGLVQICAGLLLVSVMVWSLISQTGWRGSA